ncbi:unnamed protein product [Closterium sp. NIES-64]|nr:unnamed protein product [Closterium sp. NIES-64]
MFLDNGGHIVSPWHNIPLYGKNTWLNFVCTTPRGTWAKHDFAPEEYTPLRVTPNSRNGEPSHFARDAPWHIGSLPQTWQDPEEEVDEFGGVSGCGTALEVLDLSRRPAKLGQVHTVKPIGAIPVVREEGLAWVVVAIGGGDPVAHMVNELDELPEFMPGRLEEIYAWLAVCDATSAADKPSFLPRMRVAEQGAERALGVVAQANAAWQLFLHAHVQPDPWLPEFDVFATNILQACWRKYTDDHSRTILPISSDGCPIDTSSTVAAAEREARGIVVEWQKEREKEKGERGRRERGKEKGKEKKKSRGKSREKEREEKLKAREERAERGREERGGDEGGREERGGGGFRRRRSLSGPENNTGGGKGRNIWGGGGGAGRSPGKLGFFRSRLLSLPLLAPSSAEDPPLAAAAAAAAAGGGDGGAAVAGSGGGAAGGGSGSGAGLTITVPSFRSRSPLPPLTPKTPRTGSGSALKSPKQQTACGAAAAGAGAGVGRAEMLFEAPQSSPKQRTARPAAVGRTVSLGVTGYANGDGTGNGNGDWASRRRRESSGEFAPVLKTSDRVTPAAATAVPAVGGGGGGGGVAMAWHRGVIGANNPAQARYSSNQGQSSFYGQNSGQNSGQNYGQSYGHSDGQYGWEYGQSQQSHHCSRSSESGTGSRDGSCDGGGSNINICVISGSETGENGASSIWRTTSVPAAAPTAAAAAAAAAAGAVGAAAAGAIGAASAGGAGAGGAVGAPAGAGGRTGVATLNDDAEVAVYCSKSAGGARAREGRLTNAQIPRLNALERLGEYERLDIQGKLGTALNDSAREESVPSALWRTISVPAAVAAAAAAASSRGGNKEEQKHERLLVPDSLEAARSKWGGRRLSMQGAGIAAATTAFGAATAGSSTNESALNESTAYASLFHEPVVREGWQVPAGAHPLEKKRLGQRWADFGSWEGESIATAAVAASSHTTTGNTGTSTTTGVSNKSSSSSNTRLVAANAAARVNRRWNSAAVERRPSREQREGVSGSTAAAAAAAPAAGGGGVGGGGGGAGAGGAAAAGGGGGSGAAAVVAGPSAAFFPRDVSFESSFLLQGSEMAFGSTQKSSAAVSQRDDAPYESAILSQGSVSSYSSGESGGGDGQRGKHSDWQQQQQQQQQQRHMQRGQWQQQHSEWQQGLWQQQQKQQALVQSFEAPQKALEQSRPPLSPRRAVSSIHESRDRKQQQHRQADEVNKTAKNSPSPKWSASSIHESRDRSRQQYGQAEVAYESTHRLPSPKRSISSIHESRDRSRQQYGQAEEASELHRKLSSPRRSVTSPHESRDRNRQLYGQTEEAYELQHRQSEVASESRIRLSSPRRSVTSTHESRDRNWQQYGQAEVAFESTRKAPSVSTRKAPSPTASSMRSVSSIYERGDRNWQQYGQAELQAWQWQHAGMQQHEGQQEEVMQQHGGQQGQGQQERAKQYKQLLLMGQGEGKQQGQGQGQGYFETSQNSNGGQQGQGQQQSAQQHKQLLLMGQGEGKRQGQGRGYVPEGFSAAVVAQRENPSSFCSVSEAPILPPPVSASPSFSSFVSVIASSSLESAAAIAARAAAVVDAPMVPPPVSASPSFSSFVSSSPAFSSGSAAAIAARAAAVVDAPRVPRASSLHRPPSLYAPRITSSFPFPRYSQRAAAAAAAAAAEGYSRAHPLVSQLGEREAEEEEESTRGSSHSSGRDRSRKHRKSLSMTFDSSGRPAPIHPIDPHTSTPDNSKPFDSERSQSRDTSRAAPVASRKRRKSFSMTFDSRGSATPTANDPPSPTPDLNQPAKSVRSLSHSCPTPRRTHRKSLSMTLDSQPYDSQPYDSQPYDSKPSQSRDSRHAAPVAGRRHRKSLSMTFDNRRGLSPATDTQSPAYDLHPAVDSTQISSHLRAPGPTNRRRNLRKSLSLSAHSHDNTRTSNYPATPSSNSRDNTHTPTSDGRRTPSRVRFNDEVDVLMFADVAAAVAAAASDLATAPRDMAVGSNQSRSKHGYAAPGYSIESVLACGSDSEGGEGEMVEGERELISSVSLPPLSFSLLLAQEETSTAVSSPTRFPRSKSQN